ncbi:MAG: hypothetical protein KF763_20865 [Cyclobacteriaceae bacterium]|nr:hypothetical protein [Cyclobacteriaceae bacterium]
MTDKENRLREIIEDFENRKVDGKATIDLIKDLTGETVDIGYLSEYWASESLDTFVEKLLVEHIVDWQLIDDMRAIELIIEIQENPSKEGLLIRNSTALEKRYGKSSGTVIGKIFNTDIQDAKMILDELKKETRIFL